MACRSLSARRAWIEIVGGTITADPIFPMSLSARRAWIEITGAPIIFMWGGVALRKESVDRNLAGRHFVNLGQNVALRKESVDRNTTVLHWYHISKKSLSARRAWIEIGSTAAILDFFSVALRKESVDRND